MFAIERNKTAKQTTYNMTKFHLTFTPWFSPKPIMRIIFVWNSKTRNYCYSTLSNVQQPCTGNSFQTFVNKYRFRLTVLFQCTWNVVETESYPNAPTMPGTVHTWFTRISGHWKSRIYFASPIVAVDQSRSVNESEPNTYNTT